MIIQDRNHKFLQLTIACALLAALCGCAHAETFGERARKVLAEIDKECRERQLGPYEPEPRKTGIRNSSCDILFLKPYDPLVTPEGRFAHSIKLPDEDKRKEVYRPGMTDEEYFNALCEADAGEFIFRTVDNVEGLVQMRPYEPYPGGYRDLVFQTQEMRLDNYEIAYGKSFVRPTRNNYKYFAVKLSETEMKKFGHQYLLYFLEQNSNLGEIPKSDDITERKGVPVTILSKMTDTPKSQYGFISRGLSRLNDVEHGIQGSELIVLDRETNEVLGYERVYRQLYFDSKYTDPRTVWPRACGASSRWINDFIFRILKPTN